MPRRRLHPHSWSLDPVTPLSIANARIALALLQCVRRLPGAFSSHNHDDLGAVLAPIFEANRRIVRAALKAHPMPLSTGFDCADETDMESPKLFTDRDVQSWLGRAIAHPVAAYQSTIDKVEDRLFAYVARHAHPIDGNVDMLQRLLGLEPAEAEFVRLAAAFGQGSIERSHFGFVNSDSRLHKALERFGGTLGARPLRMFEPGGALARSGLLEALQSTRNNSRDLDDLLCLSATGERLLAMPFDDEAAMARAVLTPLDKPSHAQGLSWPHLAGQQALLQAALASATAAGTRGFNVLLHGGPGTGKTEFVRQLLASAQANAFIVTASGSKGKEATRDDRLASLALSQTFAGHDPQAVLVLDEAEDIFQSDYQSPFARLFGGARESKAWMNTLLESNPHPVIWISNQVAHLDPAYLRRFALCIEFPQTPLSVRRRIAEQRLAPLGCSTPVIDAMAENAAVTPALLDSAARFSSLCAPAGLSGDGAVLTLVSEHLKAAGAKAMPMLQAGATRFDMRYLNLGGRHTPERVLAALQKPGCGPMLFSGLPGTGKTQFANALARLVGKRLVTRTASDINSKWYGESEGNVARMFRDCDPASELLFLDEAEVLLGAREGMSHRADRAVTAEFLRWLEAFEGSLICASNHAGDFDAALMRRFVFRLEFLPLRMDQRLALLGELAYGWRPIGIGAGTDDMGQAIEPEITPAIEPSIKQRLSHLDRLTAGDFANVKRRIEAAGLGADAWIDELESEQAVKPGASRRSAGFV